MHPLSTRPIRWRPITVFNLLVGLLFSLSALGQPAFLKEGLVAYYPFNGNANDESGNGPSGKVVGAQLISDRFSKDNRAYSFDGISQFIDINDPVGQNPILLTQSAWIRTTVSSPAPRGWPWVVMTKRHADDGCNWPTLCIAGENNDVVCAQDFKGGTGVGPPTVEKLKSVNVKDGRWHHLVGIRDKLKYSTYVDGVKVLETVYSNDATSGSPYNMHIGRHGAWNVFFDGSIDDVRIYNRALSDGEVKALYDYESTPQPLNSRIATATAQVVNGFVVGATITDGGYGYVENPTVTITGGGGTGAKATATQFNGAVTSITISNSGSGYTSTPTITIAPPPFPPRKATSTADIVNGFVVGAKIADGGFGYDTAPTVLLIGGGGSGATATATVVNGTVTAITIINSGSGYTSAPSIQIASPPFAPSLDIEVSKVSVRLKVVLGRKYQLEASTDLKTWTSTGPAFVAQAEELAQEFDVNQVGRYFRINQVP
jgi:hypothetical protein